MATLRITLKSEINGPGKHRYHNEVNGSNFKEVALVLTDLKNLGVPVDKAIKEYKEDRSDWDAALGY